MDKPLLEEIFTSHGSGVGLFGSMDRMATVGSKKPTRIQQQDHQSGGSDF